MRELSVKDLNILNVSSKGPMISLYLSKDMSILDNKTMEERWKELLLKAEFYLLKDYTRSYVDQFMKTLWEKSYLDKLEGLDRGVVVFHSEEGFGGETGFIRVQSSISDLIVVADSFHIKPLIRIKNNVRGFFIVTMSSRAINVLIENSGHLIKLDSYRNEPGIEGKNKKDSKDFFLNSAQELNKLFTAYRLPIILAGVKDHIGHMKKLLNQSMLMGESIVGNVEKMKAAELQENVYKILAPYYEQQELGALSELEIAMSRDRAVTYLEDIAISAVYGKIQKLFVVENRYVWGSINKQTGEIFISPRQVNAHDDDVLDDLCQLVLSKGGEVVVVKEINNFKGHYAVAIVSDRSHLYEAETDDDAVQTAVM
jgi:sporulation protein YlmC with PRC-barrel domain